MGSFANDFHSNERKLRSAVQHIAITVVTPESPKITATILSVARIKTNPGDQQ